MIAVFDLGGVLVRICRTWGQAMATAGLQAKPEHENLWFDDCPAFKAFQSGSISEDQYVVGLASFLGLGADAELGKRVHNGITMGEYPGVPELIQEVKERGWRTGCLSNTNAMHWEFLSDPGHYPTIARLDCRMASQEVGLEKPSEAIYRKYEEVFGLGPDEIVFFDDLRANVEAARACGWTAHCIDHERDTVAQIRDALLNL